MLFIMSAGAGFSSCLLRVAKGKGLLPEGLSVKLCLTNPGRGAEGGRTWEAGQLRRRSPALGLQTSRLASACLCTVCRRVPL